MFDAVVRGTDAAKAAALAELAPKARVRQLVTRNVFTAALDRYFAHHAVDADDADAAGAGAGAGAQTRHGTPGTPDEDSPSAGGGGGGEETSAARSGGDGGDGGGVCDGVGGATIPAPPSAGAAPPGAPELPVPLPLPPAGSRVICRGLKTAVELNGCVGYVMFHTPEGAQRQAAVHVMHGPSGGACIYRTLATP